MLIFQKSRNAWQTKAFSQILLDDLTQLDLNALPLQQALTFGNYATTDKMSIMLLNSSEKDVSIDINIGVFFIGYITGCHCADDPSPQTEYNEYCELAISINKTTAQTKITLLP